MIVKPAVCCDVEPCSVVEITSVSEEPATSVSRKKNYIRFFRNVGTSLPQYVALHRLENLICQTRQRQLLRLSFRNTWSAPKRSAIVECRGIVETGFVSLLKISSCDIGRVGAERGLGVYGARRPLKVEWLYHRRCGSCSCIRRWQVLHTACARQTGVRWQDRGASPYFLFSTVWIAFTGLLKCQITVI